MSKKFRGQSENRLGRPALDSIQKFKKRKDKNNHCLTFDGSSYVNKLSLSANLRFIRLRFLLIFFCCFTLINVAIL